MLRFYFPRARMGGRASPSPRVRTPVPLGDKGLALSAAGLALVLFLAGGCALTPKGTKDEQNRLVGAGGRYEPRLEDRALPELPPEPTWQDVLHRALLANGDLEAAYFDWKGAVERIDMASAYPNSNVMLGFSYSLSSERMKTFDRTMFTAGFDSMENLSFPTKVRQQGKIALDEARAAGERFRAAKFDLQRRVLSAWSRYALLAEKVRIQREQLDLARLSVGAARAQVQSGGAQQGLLRVQLTAQTAGDPVRAAEAELAAARAQLNAMLAREPDAPLAPPAAMPQPRAAPEDSVLLAAAVEQNPELAALARQTEGRSDALELARMRWIPDINPSVSFTGTVAQAIGVGVMLPTTIAEIRGGIREAQAALRASEASARQARRDRAGSFVAALVMLRDAERRADLFQDSVLPLSDRVLAAANASYAAGVSTLTDLIDAQSAVLEARLVVAEARTLREQRLAEIEALMGTDVETLLAAPTGPDSTGREPSASPPGATSEDSNDQ